jgi:hypothetical protein
VGHLVKGVGEMTQFAGAGGLADAVLEVTGSKFLSRVNQSTNKSDHEKLSAKPDYSYGKSKGHGEAQEVPAKGFFRGAKGQGLGQANSYIHIA